MTSSPLRLIAGRQALATIQQQGLREQDISLLVGASGGPKWFSLYGIDQYLLNEFFAKRSKPLDLLGSSAGAWRFACYAQTDGAAASTRFCDAYRTLCYPKNADVATVTKISHQVIDAIFPSDAHRQQILTHPVYRLNFIVAAKTGPALPNSRRRQLVHLTKVAAANLVKRAHLGQYYHRLQFCHPHSKLQPPTDLPSLRVPLSFDNIDQALLASGSIPLVLDTVRDIAGLPYQDYVDGGLTDYHFAWPFDQTGLILYPHFYPHLSPGWFDKSLPWRRMSPKAIDNLVLLCPSDAWVASLPYQKIPDRTDFNRLSDAKRIDYWQEVCERSFELADALRSQNFVVESPN